MMVKKQKMKGLGVVVFVALSIFTLNAQTGKADGSKYGRGEDSVQCVRNLSLYREFAKHDEWNQARSYWIAVFDECPKASKYTYIDGAKMYKYYLDQKPTDVRKAELMDTLMLIYERRLEYFGDPGNVRGRQAVDLLEYRRNDDIKYVQQAYGYLKESIDIEKKKSSDAVLATAMSASLTLFQNNLLSETEVIEDYLMITEFLSDKKGSRTDKLKEVIDANFLNEGPSSCEPLIEYFSKTMVGKENDTEFLTLLTSLLKSRDCTNSDLFFDASKNLHRLAPTAESAINIAIMSFNSENFDSAMAYYKQALDIETDGLKKGDYYFGIAICQQKLGNKTEARSFAQKAIQAKPNWGDPYLLIGQLYAESKDDCSSLSLPNAIYWVAVDKFNEAKKADANVEERANKLILTYSNYFPNKEKAFFNDVLEGSTYNVGCWINESTKARFKE